MSAADPLAQLHDIKLPEAVGFWPPAPVYWLAALALLALLGWGIYRLWRKRQRRQYRKQALFLLAQIPAEPGTEQLQKLNQLLKRTAIKTYGQEPASLSGSVWLAFLDRTLSGEEASFSQGVGRVLATGPYQAAPTYQASELQALVARWLEHHQEVPDA